MTDAPTIVRFALFTPNGAAFAAGGIGAEAQLDWLARRRGNAPTALIRRMDDATEDWARLLAEQLLGNPSLGTLVGYMPTVGRFSLVEGGQVVWLAPPTQTVAAAVSALLAADIPTLLQLCAATSVP